MGDSITSSKRIVIDFSGLIGSLCLLATITMTVLNLSHVTHIPWLTVFLPLICSVAAGVAIFIVVFIIALIIYVIAEIVNK